LSLVEPIKLKPRSAVVLIADISRLPKSSIEENRNGDKNDGAARQNGG
jgi:hypothetical protein